MNFALCFLFTGFRAYGKIRKRNDDTMKNSGYTTMEQSK
jgi:hypothetical protein